MEHRAPPVVANGVVYTAYQQLIAVDATTGASLYSFPLGYSIAPLAVADGHVYLVNDDSPTTEQLVAFGV